MVEMVVELVLCAIERLGLDGFRLDESGLDRAGLDGTAFVNILDQF